MHSIKITDISNQYLLAENGDVMIVTVRLFRDQEDLGDRKFTYPLHTEKAQIIADLEKMKSTLDSDHEVGVKSAELEEGLKKTEEVAQSLTDLTI